MPPQGVQGQGIPEAQGRNAFNSERPLGVTPVPEGWSILISTGEGADLL